MWRSFQLPAGSDTMTYALPCPQEFDSNYSEIAETDKGYYNTYFTQASLS